MQHRSVVHSHPEVLSGAPVFVGTRVPVRTLLDYLEGGDRLDDFLEDFPGVTRDQAIQFLEQEDLAPPHPATAARTRALSSSTSATRPSSSS